MYIYICYLPIPGSAPVNCREPYQFELWGYAIARLKWRRPPAVP
ncbi:MAG: hypothetical protein V2A69_06990 [Pseudomonadota bacterium]